MSLTNSAGVSTRGAASPGVFAQSVAGGGGISGLVADGIITMGMNGAAVANAGDVSLTNSGTVLTNGRGSSALLAQSIGGGGGFSSADNNDELFLGALYATSAQAGSVSLNNSGILQTKGQGSIALLAQSIGGGGGANAYAAQTPSLELQDRLYLGSYFSNEGIAGAVNVTNTGSRIVTSGRSAPGLLAQSVGGGGGWSALASELNARGRLGNRGGTNGSGGSVQVSNTGDIVTLGDESHAIRLQSIGGGGGAISASAVQLQMGSLDAAGDLSGGAISLDNNGSIATTGASAVGVNVLSLGGGGGTVFGSVAGIVDMGTNTSGTVNADGGAVTVNQRGTSITTEQNNASGLVAVSVGGGGGFIANVQGDLQVGSNLPGGRNRGGAVNLVNSSNISTSGNAALGLATQSIGGGGALVGVIQSASRIISIGNTGSSAAEGGSIDLRNSGSISTEGMAAPALLAQSIGGGGASGSFATEANFYWLGSSATGSKSAGGITLNSSGDLQTLGIGSQAMVVQSIGGGGGFLGDVDASFSDHGAVLLGSQGSHDSSDIASSEEWQNLWLGLLSDFNPREFFKTQIAIDTVDAGLIAFGGINVGNGGDGDGSAINLSASGRQFATRGNNASVMLAQSIGGGGGWSLLAEGGTFSMLGSIGASGGSGGAIDASTDVNLISLGKHSPALVLQSIGGGGGAVAGSRFLARLGANAGGGVMQGGSINLQHSGNIGTAGSDAVGVLVQSIGGGGGLAGDVDGAARLGATGVDIANSDLNSGAISITLSGNVKTEGNNSPGLNLQSIAGGGGWIGNVNGELLLGSTDVQGSQNSGTISLNSRSQINTLGENSTGLLAQSIAGGGGIASVNGSLYSTRLGLSGQGPASAANLSITNSGSIATAGNNATGLMTQSIGGGGGAAALRTPGEPGQSLSLGSDGGSSLSGGEISLIADADISTQGVASPAVVAQSIGGGGGAVQGLNEANTGFIRLGSTAASNANAGALIFQPADIRSNSPSDSRSIITTGNRSAGAIVQSVGGGGGWALVDSLGEGALGASELTSGTGGPVSVVFRGLLQTTGETSPVLIVQSIGGGGGFAGDVATNGRLGGTGGSGNLSVTGSSGLFWNGVVPSGNEQPISQSVFVSLQGSLISKGTTSPVMLVQAIGGGGGRLGSVGGDAVLGQRNGNGISTGGSIRVTNNSGALTSIGDKSAALVLQSIGGGGGSVNSVGGRVDLGGSGTGELQGGEVILTNSMTAITVGNDSPAVVLQSIGGGGGLAADVDGFVNLGTQSIGNTSAGNIFALADPWRISTNGRNSPGLTLQSIGGGGGLAFTSTGSVNLGGDVIGTTSAGSISASLLTNSLIQTSGTSSPAVIAQSISGGGGYVGGDGSGSAGLVELGGSGRQLGISGDITVAIGNGAQLQTTGVQSQGVIAQSIGGGGGFTSQNSAVMRLGMNGGVGNAGVVNIDNAGTIITTGNNSEGVIAQSIGGGGGTAGSSSSSLRMGASGGSIGRAGDVVVRNSGGTISTSGDYSIGVVAQSVGAGGGRVGSASGTINLGADGAAGDAGSVTLNNAGGLIATAGAYAPAYLIQSIGGGGGMAGLGQSEGSGTVVLGGGSNGTAGSGGQLILVNEGGSIQATGPSSPGVIHQSIGGGGGWIGNVPNGTVRLGGLSVGDVRGADLELSLPFQVVTGGENSPGVLLQSIGGGGGAVGDVGGNVLLGGEQQAGVDARGGSLIYSGLNRSVSTFGDDSPGVVLQSIGGGGGLLGEVNGSLSVGSTSALASRVNAGAINATSAAPISTSGVSSPGLSVQSIGGGGGLVGSPPTSVQVGGSGLGDSSAAAISVVNSGQITTTGANSSGVVLQSIGGGGVYTTTAGGTSVTLGGSVLGNNSSGAISFLTTAAIATGGSNSAAVVAQSVGGGGGAVFGVAGSEATSVSLGSDGATSNQGAAVELNIAATLSTFGDLSPAVIAQSIGGGGGYAPINSSTASGGARNSSGLDAATVSLTLTADVFTAGSGSDGLLVQSIGGGGGVLGASSTSLNLGATSGGDGDAAAVTVNSTGTISTSGDQSIGISAQSIGAGGGRAGSASGSVNLGANGARGDGASVTLNLASEGGNGSIVTSGSQSPAFVLQSIGGGGGLVFPNNTSSGGDVLLGGGSDGTEGKGDVVSFTAGGSSRVGTTGKGSSGLSFQSIGGGGGYTGSTSANAVLGGLYRGEAFAADLDLASQVAAATSGDAASALLLQSIGGGGGRAGSVGGNANLGGTAAALGLPDGRGGTVNLNLNSSLTSSGDGSITALAQSIGGGGGVVAAVGGNAVLGGLGAGQREGGALSLNLSRLLGSGGDNGAGLVAQSIGGGGGSVGLVSGDLLLGRRGTLQSEGSSSAGAISLSLEAGALVFSQGSNSPAMLVQSIGGGGGFASGGSETSAIQLGAGGSGAGGAAAAGAISWSNSGGAISSSGSRSPAVVLQSIGGGGGYSGVGGDSVSFSADGHGGSSTAGADLRATNSGTIATSGDGSFGMLLQSIGGGGGVGSSGSGAVSLNNSNTNSGSGSISLTNTGVISTSGTGAHAVVAQTIAGGGGFVFGGVSRPNSAELLGKPTGSSGNIAVNNSGTILASGSNAVALLFQNATGGAYLYQNPDGSVSAITEGQLDGVAPAGEVVVTNSGVIAATGQGGVGITKSTSAISGNLRVVNAAGALIQGGDGGSAIILPTDRVERVINYGTIVGGSDGLGVAISGPGGTDEITNYGVIAGNIVIPGITRNVYNAPEARLESQLVDLNGLTTLYQSGLVNPGGAYRIDNLLVNANYTTTDTSIYEADLVLRSGETDNLTTRFQANLSGTVKLLANQVGQAKPGTFISEGIIDAEQGIALGDLQLIAPTSAVASFALETLDNNQDLSFRYSVNYAPTGLDPNSKAVGEAVNQIQAAGSTSAFEPTAALIFAQETTSQLNSLYRQLSGEPSTVFPQVTIDAALGFQEDVAVTLQGTELNQLQRCLAEMQQLKPGETYTGDPADCGRWRSWAAAGGYDANTPGSGGSNQSSYSTNAFNTIVGADALVSPNTLVGAAGRFDNLWTTTSGVNANGRTEGWSGMVYAKQRLGSNTWLSGSFGAGSFTTDITRYVDLQNPATEQSSSQSSALGGQLRLSQEIRTGKWGSLEPRVGISWLQLNQNAYSESTSSSGRAYQQPGNPLASLGDPAKASYSLNYSSATYSSVPLEAGLDFKHPFRSKDMVITPRLSVGYAWDLANTSRNLNAQFISAPGPSFTVEGTPAPASWLNLGLGVDVAVNNRLNVYANARSQLSPGSTQAINYGGGFRWKF